MSDSARVVTGLLGLGRAGLGVGMVVRPTSSTTSVGVDSASARRTDFVARLLGARDTALGLGTALAAATGAPLRPWLFAGALCDAADATVFLSGAASGRFAPVAGYGIGLSAAGGAVGHGYLAIRVRN